ncbi:procollagen-lysine,2-oxoglutarate 5-dioxygenase 1-like isoform X2 [Mytilus galloprovincialis]|uniref:procollagen-lysine,2-oxoglutarate 5-dioxygenase 1-like isoform X2 n=1 Tax=Mytilus galloprovincialis TaxID=29158 RepID=UPI003F7C20EE
MYITNIKNWGYLVNNENFDISHIHNDLWQIFDNEYNWRKRYIHTNYSQSLEPDALIDMPCNDVVRFPVFTELFCDHLVEEMENSGKWSAGKNKDDRISGGYENVPTVDIHMNQIGFEDVWLQFIRLYARPLQRKVFIGYKGVSLVMTACLVKNMK